VPINWSELTVGVSERVIQMFGAPPLGLRATSPSA